MICTHFLGLSDSLAKKAAILTIFWEQVASSIFENYKKLWKSIHAKIDLVMIYYWNLKLNS